MQKDTKKFRVTQVRRLKKVQNPLARTPVQGTPRLRRGAFGPGANVN
jgi:hypothetical protein